MADVYVELREMLPLISPSRQSIRLCWREIMLLEKLCGKFASVKFFLTRDNLREVIVRR
jgi:hypothetical protein